MSGKILVAYASKYGATAQIAEKIALRFVKSGLTAEALSAKKVTGLAEYKAILLGSGVYMGMWLKEAADFLKTHESELAKMPVWFFSDGPTGAGDPKELMKNWTFPEDLKPIADRIKPRGIVSFHGVIEMSKLNFAEKLIIKGVKAPIGDFRDWDMINDWADGITDALKDI
jgi:menaquinone-dependent protoporphyrinogen oxidase